MRTNEETEEVWTTVQWSISIYSGGLSAVSLSPPATPEGRLGGGD